MPFFTCCDDKFFSRKLGWHSGRRTIETYAKNRIAVAGVKLGLFRPRGPAPKNQTYGMLLLYQAIVRVDPSGAPPLPCHDTCRISSPFSLSQPLYEMRGALSQAFSCSVISPLPGIYVGVIGSVCYTADRMRYAVFFLLENLLSNTLPPSSSGAGITKCCSIFSHASSSYGSIYGIFHRPRSFVELYLSSVFR